jgi:hypothetical protein
VRICSFAGLQFSDLEIGLQMFIAADTFILSLESDPFRADSSRCWPEWNLQWQIGPKGITTLGADIALMILLLIIHNLSIQ